MESKYQLATTWDGDKTTTLFKEVLMSDHKSIKNVLKAAQDIKIEKQILAQHKEKMKGAPALIITQPVVQPPVIDTLSSTRNAQHYPPGDYYRRKAIPVKTWRDYKNYIIFGVIAFAALLTIESIPGKSPSIDSAPVVEQAPEKTEKKKKKPAEKKKTKNVDKKQPTTYTMDDVFNTPVEKPVKANNVRNKTDKVDNKQDTDEVDNYKMMDQLKMLGK